MPVITGCATCKGRGISCDRIKPKCTNCSRSNRKCQWHNLKLSWPRADDRRRSVVSKESPLSPNTQRHISDARFVHTTNLDIELYHNLIGSGPIRSLSLIDPTICWDNIEFDNLDSDLIEYFCYEASTSLATFGQDTSKLAKFLLRISLEGGKTASAAALLEAVIAFSSLHRYGLQSQAVEAKIAALGSLAEGSFEPSYGAIEAIQHIGTLMLLCSFEVHQASCSSGQWTQYLDGVRTVVNASSIKKLLQFSPDVIVLLDWFHYYEVLARFSRLHWKRDGVPELLITPTDHFYPQISTLPSPVLSMLNLLSQAFDTASSRSVSPETSENYSDHKNFVEVLDWRIRSLSIPTTKETTETDNNNNDSTITTPLLKLHQLATLIYLTRSSPGLLHQPIRTQQQIDSAFQILQSELKTCKQQFPIFIVGCEAKTDDQRAIILDVISRTENCKDRGLSSRSFNHCRRLLQAFWAQDDLAEWGGISYRGKLESILGLARIVPAFV